MKLTKLQLREIVREEVLSLLLEHAKDYIWGVKGPGRVANQYKLMFLKEALEKNHLKQDSKEEK